MTVNGVADSTNNKATGNDDNVKAQSGQNNDIAYNMPIDLPLLIQKTFLSLYDVTKDTKYLYQNADYVFEIGKKRICVFIAQQQVKLTNNEVDKSEVLRTHIQMAKDLLARYEMHKASINDDSQETVNNTHYIAISRLVAEHQGTIKEIAHEYGSNFYKAYLPEASANSSDSNTSTISNTNSPLLQLLSLNSLRILIKTLPTPSDSLAFLHYYRGMLNNKVAYPSETRLVSSFLSQPIFFKPALDVQLKLVEAGLLEKVESRLLQASEPMVLKDTSTNAATKDNLTTRALQGLELRETLIPKMHQFADLYHKILSASLKNSYNENQPLPLELARLLVSESMYTRLSIMEEFMAYPKQSEEDRQEGFERHQHSFNVFGRHYMVVFYATDPNAYYSKNNIKQAHQDLLLELNAELQQPLMEDIFILGFELLPATDIDNSDSQNSDAIKAENNVQVSLDIYHRKGAPLTDNDKVRLAELNE